jgi:hypothetical protein
MAAAAGLAADPASRFRSKKGEDPPASLSTAARDRRSDVGPDLVSVPPPHDGAARTQGPALQRSDDADHERFSRSTPRQQLYRSPRRKPRDLSALAQRHRKTAFLPVHRKTRFAAGVASLRLSPVDRRLQSPVSRLLRRSRNGSDTPGRDRGRTEKSRCGMLRATFRERDARARLVQPRPKRVPKFTIVSHTTH